MKFADVLKTLSNDQLIEIRVWDEDNHKFESVFMEIVEFMSSNCRETYGDYEVTQIASFIDSPGGSGVGGEDYIRLLLERKVG